MAGAVLCALPLMLGHQLLQGQLLLCLSHIVPENNSGFSDLPAGSSVSLHEAASAFQKVSLHHLKWPRFLLSRFQTRSQARKDKNHDMTLKPSSPNTWHAALSTTIPLPPNPPYLTRTHVRNNPVFWNLFWSQDLCSARPSTQSHIAAQELSLVHCFCLQCLGSEHFFWTHAGYALRAGMKLFGFWVIWHCGLPISSCWMWAIPNMFRHSPWESKQVWLGAYHSTSQDFSIAAKAKHLAGWINPCWLCEIGFIENKHLSLTF